MKKIPYLDTKKILQQIATHSEVVSNLRHSEDKNAILKYNIRHNRAHNLHRLTYRFKTSEFYQPTVSLDFVKKEFAERPHFAEYYNFFRFELAELDQQYPDLPKKCSDFFPYFTLLSNHFAYEQVHYRTQDAIQCRFGCTKFPVKVEHVEERLQQAIDSLDVLQNFLLDKKIPKNYFESWDFRLFAGLGWMFFEAGLTQEAQYFSKILIKVIAKMRDNSVPIKGGIILNYRQIRGFYWICIMCALQEDNREKAIGYLEELDSLFDYEHWTLGNSNIRVCEALIVLYRLKPSLDIKKKIDLIMSKLKTYTLHEGQEVVRERLLVMYSYYETFYKIS